MRILETIRKVLAPMEYADAQELVNTFAAMRKNKVYIE